MKQIKRLSSNIEFVIVGTDQVALKIPNFMVFLTTRDAQAKSMLWLDILYEIRSMETLHILEA